MTNALKRQLFLKNRLILFLCLFLLLFVIDHYIEFLMGASGREMMIDLILELPRLALLIILLLFAFRELSRERYNRYQLQKSLSHTHRAAQEWERKATNIVGEFAREVEGQFCAWGFTKSEKEVALLILKGKSTKDIAMMRFTSDRTIRNQCQSIYEKSSLAGRHELAGYFFEQFMPKTE